MKQNKYLKEVWEWKEKLNSKLVGLSIKESSEKINNETSKTITVWGLKCIKSLEKVQSQK